MQLLRPTDPQSTSLEEVRRRLQEDGYVFLKGLLPRADVMRMREKYFQYLSSTGLLKPGSAPVDGIFDPAQNKNDYPGIGVGVISPSNQNSAEFMRLAIKAHGEPWYKDDFCQHPAFTDYISKLTGWEEHTHNIKRTMLRNNTPGNKAIGVHYDYIFLRHGEESVLTAWVPIGDIKINGGGLIYLEKGMGISRNFYL
jgi:phytanoyl-CoA hydroxylase